MRLKIRLIDHIKAINICQLVETTAVRIVRRTNRIDIRTLQRDEILLEERGIHRPPMIGVKLVTVDSLEHDALAVDLHDSISDAELTETDAHAHDLLQNPRRITHADHKMVEPWVLRAPKKHAGSLHRAHMGLCRDDRLFPLYAISFRIAEQNLDMLFCRIAECEVHIKLSVRIAIPLKRHGTNGNILDVMLRFRVEQDVAIDSREPPEVLIFEPARARITEDHRRQLVLPRHEIRRQVEVCRRAAVFTVADEMTVEEECERRIHAAKGDIDALPILGHGKILHIAADGIIAHGNLARHDALMPVPRVRRIRVMRRSVPLHLYMHRHTDRLPIAAVIIRRLESLRDVLGVPRIGEMPNAVERAVK